MTTCVGLKSHFIYLHPDKTRTHHVGHFEETIGEDDGVGRRGHRQHEGKGGAQGAGDHHIQGVQAYGLGLGQDTEKKIYYRKYLF